MPDQQPPSNLDQVREILFGQQSRASDAAMTTIRAAMDEQQKETARRIAMMQRSFAEQIERLKAEMQAEVQALGQRLGANAPHHARHWRRRHTGAQPAKRLSRHRSKRG